MNRRGKTLGLSIIVGFAGLAAALTASDSSSGEDQPTPLPRIEGPVLYRAPEEPNMPPVPAEVLNRQTESPAATAAFGPFVSVQVNVNALGNNIVGDAANESSIAIDPTNPNRIVIGWRQFDSIASNFREAGWAYSHDGGQTWTFPGAIENGLFHSDPVLHSDANGNFYYSGLINLGAVEVWKSIDGGVTWGPGIAAFGGDKQWMVIDDRPGGSGHIYQNWNEEFTCCEGFDFTRSINAGASFQGPYTLPLPRLKWGTMDVGANGTLYVAGTNLNQDGHLFTKSTNAQNPAVDPTFAAPMAINMGGIVPFNTAPNPAGLAGQTWMATDHSTGCTAGNIYVLQSLDRSGDVPDDPMDVLFIRSNDDGATWSTPIRVNPDPPNVNSWQWMGTMSVAPNGRIDVAWVDTSITGAANMGALFYSGSLNAGTNWTTPVQLGPVWDSHVGWPQQNKIGDYYHMISDNGGANLAYAATFNGEQDVYFVRIPVDCNNNGIEDDTDVLLGTSGDCNANVVPDECEPIADCNGNTIADICDIGAGTSVDCNCDRVPDECDLPVCSPSLAPQPAPLGPRNRYLSVVPQGSCQSQAIRVTFVDLPAPYDVWNGAQLWVDDPVEVSELSGLGPGDPPTPPTAFFAGLTCAGPVYRDWISLGTVHIHHEGIVPDGRYEVDVSDAGCTVDEGNFSAPLAVTNGGWGDIAGPFIGGVWTAPNGSVDITADAVADLEKFGNRPGAPAKARADVEPRRVDLKINIPDATRIIDAFRGLPYPFTPSTADPCDAG